MQQLDDDQILRRTKFAHLSDLQFAYLMRVCQKRGLDPWLNDVCAEVRNRGGRPDLTIIVTITALRRLAEQSEEFAGRRGPFWCGPDNQWHEVWTRPEFPTAARVGIIRQNHDGIIWGTARWETFCQWKLGPDGQTQMDEFWAKMGDHMLAKCAEANGLRAAFPQRFAGLYIPEEMMQAKSQRSTEVDDSAPTSEFLFQLRLVRDFELAGAAEREAAIKRMRDRFPGLDGREFYAAALSGLAEEKSAAVG